MPIQVSTSGATSGNLTQYETAYREGTRPRRLYDQFASPMKEYFERRGSTGTAFWLQSLLPRPTTAIGNETSDFDPQTLRDSSTTITKSYYADGLKEHELVHLKSSLLAPADFARAVGDLAMQTIDALARRVVIAGSLVIYGDAGASAHTTRATMDQGTSNDHLAFSTFTRARAYLGNFDKDDTLMAVMDPWAYEDLILTAGNAMITYGTSDERLYNYELGKLAGIRIVVSPFAKAFYAAGAANATAISTTIATSTTANIAGAKTIEVASAASIAAGMWLTVGTVESGAESDDTLKTELVQVVSINSTTLTIAGKGAGGGLLYDHAVGATVKNNDTVHCVSLGHSASIAVDFDGFGRYGKLVTPFQDGNAKQWTTYSFKYYGGYGRLDETELVRFEVSSTGL